MCTASAVSAAGSDCAVAGSGVSATASAVKPTPNIIDPSVMDPFPRARHRSPPTPTGRRTRDPPKPLFSKALKMCRLEECVEGCVDRFGQRIPASAQKRRKEAKQTEHLDQGGENKIEECRSSRGSQPHLVTHHVVIRNFLNIRRRPPE